MAVLSAIHEHARGISDSLAARFIVLSGITLVMVTDMETDRAPPSTQVLVHEMEPNGMPKLEPVESFT